MSNCLIPCQCCGHMLPQDYGWFVCDQCGFRVCPYCLSTHTGTYGNGGYKCSRCPNGHLDLKKA